MKSTDWKSIRVDGFGALDRVVGEFVVGPPIRDLPIASFRIRVLERANGSFLAIPNIAVRDEQGQPDWVCGLGDSLEDAVKDCLEHLAKQIIARPVQTEADLAWSEPEDF